MSPKRGSFPLCGCVYRVRLDPAFGHEIRKTRPAVVVSNDHMNELAATVLIMPITTGHYDYYHWISLKPPEGGLTKPSSIVTEQIRAIDKRRIRRRLDKVGDQAMTEIEAAIRDHFGLPEGRIVS